MKKITLIVGARPNFMKAFPVYESLKSNFELTLIHTGQHFDEKMSKVFFDELGFPKPDIHFDLTSKLRAGDLDNKLYVQNKEYLKNIKNVIDEFVNYDGKKLGQLGEIRDKLYNHFEKSKPDMVIVFGDVTSTLSASLACRKLNIEIAHVESGLRSGDLSMPEEVNRILTDNMSSYFFVTEQAGVDNLKKEGITENVFLVGNTMIDTQKKHLDKALNTKYNEKIGVKKGNYVLITLHRPSNVDDMNKLQEIFDDFFVLSKTEKLVYPIHPRTKINLEKIGYLEKIRANKNIILDDPLGYLEFTCLIANCKYLITDSGGLQEESTALNIPCFTLRENTERPATLIENQGTNQMIRKISDIKLKECKGNVEFWDGESSKRIRNKLIYYNICCKKITNLNEIKYNEKNIYNYNNFYFLCNFNYKNKYLVVNFHGAIPQTLGPIFRGYDYNINNTDIVCISDYILDLYKHRLLYNKQLCNWSLSTKKHNIDALYNEVLSVIIGHKKYYKVVFTGTSAGGFPSIKFASYFNAIAIISNSQLYLENYNKRYYCPIRHINKMLDIDDEVIYENNMIEKIILQSKPKKIIYYQNINDIGPNPHNSYGDFLQFMKFIENNNLSYFCDFISFYYKQYDVNQHNIQFPNNLKHIDILKDFLINS